MVELTHLPVDNRVREKDELAWVVHCLCRDRDEGPSGMRAEHLLTWLQAAIREESHYPTLWDKFGLIQSAFYEVHHVEECTYQTIVLIPKVMETPEAYGSYQSYENGDGDTEPLHNNSDPVPR